LLGGIVGGLLPVVPFLVLFRPIYDVGMYMLLPPAMVIGAVIGCVAGFAVRGPKAKKEDA
jgi:hypothetical protein